MDKVKIKRTPNADTRSLKGAPTYNDVLNDTLKHIKAVEDVLRVMSKVLLDKGKNHDYTKIEDIYDFYELISNPPFDKNSRWWKRHITEERHHLLDFAPDDVNLFDVLEMIADVNAAGMARTGDVFEVKMTPELLMKAFENTMKLVKSSIEVED